MDTTHSDKDTVEGAAGAVLLPDIDSKATAGLRRADPSDDISAYLAAVARDDDFEVVKRLGSSAGPATELVRYRGLHGSTLGLFVRKRIPLEGGAVTALEELSRLMRAGRRFVHIPRIIDLYKTASALVVVREYVPGETLDAYRARRAQEEGEAFSGVVFAREVFPAICAAAAELHGACEPPLIHRDIKPGNIIVAPEGLFLIDFGIARQVRDGATQDTVRFGTRAYAPPEQYGFGQTDVRSDVFALGMVLWWCMTGDEHPERPAPAAAEAQAGSALAAVVLKATAFDPAERFGSACELADAFAVASGMGPVSASSGTAPGVSGPRRMPSGRAPRSDGAALALDIALAALALIITVVGVQTSITSPGTLAGTPWWYQAGITLFCLVLIWGPLYFAADKRWVYRLLPRLRGRTWRDDLICYGTALGVLFLVLIVLASIAGV